MREAAGKLYYLSSYFIVVQVKSCPCIVSIFQYVDKAPRLLLSKPDVITTSSPLPVAVSFSLFPNSTSTSGYVAHSALERDFLYDSRCTNGMDKRGLFGGYKKMEKQKRRLSFRTQIKMRQSSLCIF